MWIPTLVYEIKYPRTKEIRCIFLVKKIIYAIICMLLDYIVVSDYIIPIIETAHK